MVIGLALNVEIMSLPVGTLVESAAPIGTAAGLEIGHALVAVDWSLLRNLLVVHVALPSQLHQPWSSKLQWRQHRQQLLQSTDQAIGYAMDAAAWSLLQNLPAVSVALQSHLHRAWLCQLQGRQHRQQVLLEVDQAIGFALDAATWSLLRSLFVASAAPQSHPYRVTLQQWCRSPIGLVQVVVIGNLLETPTAGNVAQRGTTQLGLVYLQQSPLQHQLVTGHVRGVVTMSLQEAAIVESATHLDRNLLQLRLLRLVHALLWATLAHFVLAIGNVRIVKTCSLRGMTLAGNAAQPVLCGWVQPSV